MQLVLTNHGTRPVPIMSSQDKGWADALPADEPYVLDRPDTVVIVGDKPDFLDELKDALESFVLFVKKILLVWRTPSVNPQGVAEPNKVDLAIDNQGKNAVRVILGSNVSDFELQPGNVYVAIAYDYIEIRELGV